MSQMTLLVQVGAAQRLNLRRFGRHGRPALTDGTYPGDLASIQQGRGGRNGLCVG